MFRFLMILIVYSIKKHPFHLDAPTIRLFNGKLLEDNSMKMTCLADGLPKPTYVIKLSNGLSFTADIHGVIVIKNHKAIGNTTYVCIAKNSQGQDQWRLNGILTFSKGKVFCCVSSVF